jgi:hypothetical protein
MSSFQIFSSFQVTILELSHQFLACCLQFLNCLSIPSWRARYLPEALCYVLTCLLSTPCQNSGKICLRLKKLLGDLLYSRRSILYEDDGHLTLKPCSLVLLAVFFVYTQNNLISKPLLC